MVQASDHIYKLLFGGCIVDAFAPIQHAHDAGFFSATSY